MKRRDLLLAESDLHDNLENSSTVWYDEDLHCCSRDSDKYTQNLKYISCPKGGNEFKHAVSMFKSLSVIINQHDLTCCCIPIEGYKLRPENLYLGKTLFYNSENFMDYSCIDY